MSLRKLFLPALAFLLIPYSAATAQQTPAPAPNAPDAPMDFTLFVDGGSFLGIHPEEVTRENMSRFNLREPRGVAIAKVIEGSPAEKAGLRKDDVVLRFNGEEVTGVRKLNRLISEVAPDHTARLTINRNGSEQELSVTLGNRKDFSTARVFGFPRDGEAGKLLGDKQLGDLYGAPGAFTLALGSSRLIGVSTNTLTTQLADYFGIAGGKGVLITSVKDDSPAARAGIKAGDVITNIDGEVIEDAGDLSRAINRKSEGDITLTITRDKSQRTIKVTPEKGQAMPGFAPGFRFETPRIGQMSIPRIQAIPRIEKTMLPRIQALPRVRALIGTRPL